MALAQDSYTIHVAARIEEYVDDRVTWQRSLWQLGTVLALREVGEYADQLRRGAIKEEGLKFALQAAQAQCEKDLAVSSDSSAVRIKELLASAKDLRSEYVAAQLGHLADRVEAGYLKRWASAATAGSAVPSAERASRFIASHMLDAELSPHAIRAWVREIHASSGSFDFVALCNSADELISEPAKKFKVIVPFRRFPDLTPAAKGSEERSLLVLDEAAARERLGDNAIEFQPSFGGALQLHVTARDPAAAVTYAQELLARLLARLSVSPIHADSAELFDSAVVIGTHGVYPLSQQRRSVRLPSIDRSKSILKVRPYAEADALDDALELLAYFEQGTPGAALTGGWAALESLLVLPGEPDVLAADRLAAIVACDFPRAELTWLAHARLDKSQTDQSVIDAVHPSSTVTERVQRLERALADGAAAMFVRPTDNAGLTRIRDLLANPADGLRKIHTSVTEALRRLYMQRNLVMHAGSLASVTRRATLRSAPTLASAGVDRLVMAASFAGVTPLHLAARAETELKLLPAGAPLQPLGGLLM
ncbi:hypothetical protein GCM10009827_078640 [Dactylosporangium maewongense]|uniref:Apea-like HEPN domain-containing protein n=1 Tax=Dactylosporangium maewongense TaxID=634393 RepID=A0ABN2BSF2_9ACTN